MMERGGRERERFTIREAKSPEIILRENLKKMVF